MSNQQSAELDILSSRLYLCQIKYGAFSSLPIFWNTEVSQFYWLIQVQSPGGEVHFHHIFAIFNLTLWSIYAIPLSEYSTDNYSSHSKEGIGYDRDP